MARTTACDGKSLSTESADTQATFRAVWADAADERWVIEHEQQVRCTGAGNDGGCLPDGAPCSRDSDCCGGDCYSRAPGGPKCRRVVGSAPTPTPRPVQPMTPIRPVVPGGTTPGGTPDSGAGIEIKGSPLAFLQQSTIIRGIPNALTLGVGLFAVRYVTTTHGRRR